MLGSGWSEAVGNIRILKSIPYSDLPGMGNTSVTGHAGKLLLAEEGGKTILIFQGRRHFYEGDGWIPVLMPVYIAISMKVGNMLLTNAAGGINPKLKPGSIMLIKDHINLMGSNPLAGPHNPVLGERFPDQTEVYSSSLRAALEKSAKRSGLTFTSGVYIGVSGPSYETPAEIRAFAGLGADAIGMSTVPEAIVANAAGIKVAALSCIANAAAGGTKITHQEVLLNSRKVMPALAGILADFCRSPG